MLRRAGSLAMIWAVMASAAPVPVAPVAITPAPIAPEIVAWAFPGQRPAPPAGGWDRTALRTLPGSTAHFTEAQLHDLDHAVDWRPASHPPMPGAVAQGRAPGVHACGYCHLPDGSGRTENASLAGLPRDYIVEQVAAFANGTRRAAVPGSAPAAMMAEVARNARPDEIAAAADYFSRLHYTRRIRVVETATVPAPTIKGFVLVAEPGSRREPIGQRVIETPDNFDYFEMRDSAAGYTAYVPPGSLARGAAVVERVGCPACHGAGMKAWGAGRSPTYIYRQLLAFQTGARHNSEAAPMTAVSRQLTTPDMIAVAAYWASLEP